MRTFTSLAVLVGLSAFADAYGYNSCPDNKCQKSATPYCSSYLKVPEKTTTIKKTTTKCVTETSTKYKGTKTITGYPVTTEVKSTTTPVTTSFETIKTVTTITITAAPKCTAPSLLPEIIEELPEVLPKRGYPPSYSVPKPNCFKAYKEKKQIQSACKCLNIKPSTKTIKKTKTVSTTSTTTKTIKKTTVTYTPTITNTKTVTAATSTVTEKKTEFTSTATETVTAGDLAAPTGAFNIVLTREDADGGLTAVEGLRATFSVTNVQSIPINFLAPVAGTVLGTSFSLVDGALFAGDATSPAFLSDILGNDPQQVTTGTTIGSTDIQTQMFCDIDTSAGRCELICSGFPEGSNTGGGERKRGTLEIDPTPVEPVPVALFVPYVCGADNSYNLGSGEDAQTSDATCTKFIPIVVEAEDVIIDLK